MNMKLFPTALTMLILLLTACSPKIADKLAWQSNPVTIDGLAPEYQNFRYYDASSKIFYSFSNDRTNLYICLKTSDNAMQMKIMKAGMEIWIDTTSKAKKQTGILFPLADITKTNFGGAQPQMNNEGQKPDISRIKQNFFLAQTYMQLIGFKKATNGLSRLEDKSGIKVRMNWDSTNTLIYESIVPLKTFYRESLSDSDSNKIFTLTINVNGIEMPGMLKGGHPGGEGPGGEMGGQGGGRMPGGGGRQGGPPHGGSGMETKNAMTGKNVFSKNFRLEVKAN